MGEKGGQIGQRKTPRVNNQEFPEIGLRHGCTNSGSSQIPSKINKHIVKL